MATRLMRFISETQARLGWVDTTSERLLFQTAREIKVITKTPKRLLASLLIMATITRPIFALVPPGLDEIIKAITAKVDAINLLITQGNAFQHVQSSLNQVEWVKNLVHNYNDIKLTKARFEAMYTFNLKEQIKAISIAPEINLKSNSFLGGAETNGYTPLRVRSRSNDSNKGTINAGIFTDFLDKVADKNFDAMQVIKYSASENDAVAVAILNGKPDEAGKATEEQWKKILDDQNNSNNFDTLVKKAQSNLNDKMKLEQEELTKSINKIKYSNSGSSDSNRLDQDERIVTDLLDANQIIRKKSLELSAKEISDGRENNETNKAGVTYMVEAARINAQIQSIINDTQDKVAKIIELSDRDNQSPTERTNAANSKIEMIKKIQKTLEGGQTDHKQDDSNYDLEEDVLAKMKLRPSSEAEINRLMMMAQMAINQQHIQLVDLQERERRIKAMDDAGKENFDKQYNLQQKFTPVNKDLYINAKQSNIAMDNYKRDVKDIDDNGNKKVASKPISDSIKYANDTYLATTKKHASFNVLMTIIKAYIHWFKTFFRGKSFNDVIKNNDSAAKSQEDQHDREMLDMYDKCAGASNV